MHNPPFTVSLGETELLLPISGERDAAEVSAAGMTAYVDSVGISAETRGVLVDPGDTAAYLRRHHAEMSTGLLDRNEVQGDVMRPGLDEHLRRVAVIAARYLPARRRHG